MSSNASAPPATSATKQTTILSSTDGKAKKPVDPVKKNKAITTTFRIALTLFYGQFLANGIYDNLIRTIPYLVDKEVQVYPVIKVVIGFLILGQGGFAMVAIWMRIKQQKYLLFISAILLIILSIASLVISVIDVVQKRVLGTVSEKDYAADIAELSVQALFR